MTFSMTNDWNPAQAEMREAFRKEATFARGLELCLYLHQMAHLSDAFPGSGSHGPTLMDELWQGLDENVLRRQPTAKGWPIAWHIWHITRIEDLVANVLIAEREALLDDAWMRRTGSAIRDTGNALTPAEMIEFSKTISLEGLTAYRNAVATRTREVLVSLSFADMKRKPSKSALGRVMDEGGLTQAEESFWLLDFWGGKTMAGLLGMPITRHQSTHINPCLKLKKKR